jgi:peptidyl-prolyl cis-trans isomerase C
MRILFALVIGSLAAPLFVNAAEPATSTKPIAKVNGLTIPQSRFELVARSQLTQGQEDTPKFREDLREILITREVLAQEALRRKLDKDPNYVAQMDVMKQQILLGVLFDEFVKKNEPTEAALRKEYDRVKAETVSAGGKQYLARHILLKEEGEAKAIIEQLQGGGDFEAIAKEKSTDTGSREDGGALGWSEPQRFVAPFGDALRQLKKGEFTRQPVQTQFGYHVILLVDERPVPFPEFDAVKDQVRQGLMGKARDEYIDGLRAKAKIEKIGSVSAAAPVPAPEKKQP